MSLVLAEYRQFTFPEVMLRPSTARLMATGSPEGIEGAELPCTSLSRDDSGCDVKVAILNRSSKSPGCHSTGAQSSAARTLAAKHKAIVHALVARRVLCGIVIILLTFRSE